MRTIRKGRLVDFLLDWLDAMLKLIVGFCFGGAVLVLIIMILEDHYT